MVDRTPAVNRSATGLVVLAVLLAGCGGSLAGSDDGATPSPTPSPTVESPTVTPTPISVPGSMAVPDGPESYPDPPGILGASAVKQVALDYEAAYVQNALAAANISDVDISTTTEPKATVLKRGTNGYVVSVTRFSYSYTDGSYNADFTTEARYFVNTSTVARLDGSSVVSPE
jgi:hypothetical protein